MQKRYSQKEPRFKGTLARAAALSTVISLSAMGCVPKSISKKNPMLEPISTIGGWNSEDSRKMSIVDFTGQVQIKLGDGSIIGIVPGAPVPNIPSDAEITVVSGWAQFAVGNTFVRASEGNSFFFKIKRKSFKIKTTGIDKIRIVRGKKDTDLMPGKSITLKFNKKFDEPEKSKKSKQESKTNTVNMEILSFAGQISVKLKDGSTVDITPGAPTVTIPPNSQIYVDSKFAVFGAGWLIVGADAGESFLFDSEGTSTGIKALKVRTHISVSVGKTREIKLKAGDSIVVQPKEDNKARIIIARNGKIERKIVSARNIGTVFE